MFKCQNVIFQYIRLFKNQNGITCSDEGTDFIKEIIQYLVAEKKKLVLHSVGRKRKVTGKELKCAHMA